jgi:hypothetical protein
MVFAGNIVYISPAFGAGGPGFKSRRAHHKPHNLFKRSDVLISIVKVIVTFNLLDTPPCGQVTPLHINYITRDNSVYLSVIRGNSGGNQFAHRG